MYRELDRQVTGQHEDLRATAHRFAVDVLRPAAAALDRMEADEAARAGSPLWDVFRRWYALGHHTTGIPVEFGGVGLDALSRHLVLEELGWGSAGLAVGLGVASLPFEFVALVAGMTGNQQLLDEVVTPFVNDDEARFVGCWAITEPSHGSDALGVGTEGFTRAEEAGACRAVADGDEWLISGEKAAWVSNGSIATHALLFCTVEPAMGPAGGGVALVELNGPGVERGRPLDKLGQRDLNQGAIRFEGARLPAHRMLVGPEAYPVMLSAVLAFANAGMGAIFTGLARAAFEQSLAYARIRRQGGRLIADHQLIQGKLFEMFSAVERSRALSRAALVHNVETFPPALAYSIASKVSCTQTAFAVASEAIEVFGGVGLSREMPVEKLFRDARASLIEDGVNEFLALVGARQVLDTYSIDAAS
ncbi:MAG TPA: acyl-CoA dehydrogenase family protein [Acidimicrobiales bacterium]|jgi:alkylation response protein AidB-like acyl-CoA dehydrogenase|nr:acyl-CoA dehydrogenase family protein [Acidimicrobiales bacterium]